MTERREIPSSRRISLPDLQAGEVDTSGAEDHDGVRHPRSKLFRAERRVEGSEDQDDVGIVRRRLLCHLCRVLRRNDDPHRRASLHRDLEYLHRLRPGGQAEGEREDSIVGSVDHHDRAALGGQRQRQRANGQGRRLGGPDGHDRQG